jgi:hypothetical protein
MEINGGTSETEVKELTVRPWGRLSASKTVAMVTPVANRPQARRNSSLETGAGRPVNTSLDMWINSIISCG